MGGTCFTVHGQCPGAILGSDEKLSCNHSNKAYSEPPVSAPSRSWPSSAQFRWQRPARFASRQPKHQLHISRSAANSTSRMATNYPTNKCYRAQLPPTSSQPPLPLPDTTPRAPPSPTPQNPSFPLQLTLPRGHEPHTATLPTSLNASNTPSAGLQHLALLACVGPSRLEAHTTAQFLLARAATCLTSLLPSSSSSASPTSGTRVSHQTHEPLQLPAFGPHGHISPARHPAVASGSQAGATAAGARGEVMVSLPSGGARGDWGDRAGGGGAGGGEGAGALVLALPAAQQLPAVCLASVAATLLQLPTMCCGDGGWALAGLLVGKLSGGRMSLMPHSTRLELVSPHHHHHLYHPHNQLQQQQEQQQQHEVTNHHPDHQRHHNHHHQHRLKQLPEHAIGLTNGGGATSVLTATTSAAAPTATVLRLKSGSTGNRGTTCVNGCAAGGGVERSVHQDEGLEEGEEAPAGGRVGSRAEGGGAISAAVQQQQQQRPKLFDNPLRYVKLLFAGAMSAVVSRTCVAPLERVKMDLLLRSGAGAGGSRRGALDTAAQVLRSEGIAGFWKGNALNVLRTAPFKAVNFFSFDMYHTALLALSGRDGNVERFAAGACAGITATLVCFPLDVVRTRLMAAVAGPCYGPGPFATLAGILRHEGAAALYSGCLPAVIGMAPAGAVFYGVYDMLKHQHVERMRAAVEETGAGGGGGEGAEGGHTASAAEVQAPPVVPPLYTLLYGAMAGAASELIVYPLEVVRRKMQLQSMALAGLRQAAAGGGGAGPGAHMLGGAGGRLAAAAASHHPVAHPLLGAAGAAAAGTGPHRALMLMSAAAVANSPGLARVAAAVSAILRADGPRGFYSGMLPNMLQVLPSAALSYYTYDTLKSALGAG